jgi:hypothetical protein
VEVGGLLPKVDSGKSLRLHLEKKNQTKSKRTEGVAQVEEYLPSKLEAVNLIPSKLSLTSKKKDGLRRQVIKHDRVLVAEGRG